MRPFVEKISPDPLCPLSVDPGTFYKSGKSQHQMNRREFLFKGYGSGFGYKFNYPDLDIWTFGRGTSVFCRPGGYPLLL